MSVLTGLGISASAGPLAAEEAAIPAPISANGRVVVLTPRNTQELSGKRRLARIAFPNAPVSVLGAHLKDPAHQFLRRLVVSGQAAGNVGDLYENRDRNHSRLSPKAFPQLTHVTYGEVFQKQGLDYGLGQTMFFDAPLIGNSSTAVKGNPLWRSLPRLALTTGGGAERLFQNYVTGQIHVYPENADHDPESGDLLPANTPYMLISQGSSGSDRPHLEALAMILAAFRPDTKAFLRENGLVASTVQMVYRRARVGVRTRAAYLSGAAHPTVFRDRDIALARMVGLANAIQPGEVPPMVRLKVLEESRATEGIDYFGKGLGERLFDTPSAIARVWRSREGRRSMVVTAADTKDPNGRDLSFEWVVLRGDHDRIQITPLSEDGRYAQIDMDWQAPQPAPGSPDIMSSRIDIGVFANNGIHDSAPAFISVLLPQHETRDYAFDADGPPKVKRIDRQAQKGVYVDPRVFPDTRWKDVYHYDDEGLISGWTRYRRGDEGEYNSEGRRSLQDGSGGLGAVSYLLERGEKGRFVVKEQPFGAGE
ncbi:hypothetical protein [uncultured Shimia sp.]|uniref:hypothetical protein n=1 Tax=uncultured Shimia sp. TaxID=573152 RepID=UPI002617C504|nr:hypothetical protein [uncultured Shimia sp.]